VTKHTPGPWSWGDGWTAEAFGYGETHTGEKYADLRLMGPSGQEIIPIRIDHFEIIVDAKWSVKIIPSADRTLIAAAPDLLEAAKAARDTCPADPDINERWNAAWNSLLVAIAKAEGNA